MANETTDIKRLQEEAIARVQEMQSRAERQLHRTPPAPPPPKPEPPLQQPLPAQPQRATQDLLDALTQDGDRTLILILLLILFQEQADSNTIFSLLYLLL